MGTTQEALSSPKTFLFSIFEQTTELKKENLECCATATLETTCINSLCQQQINRELAIKFTSTAPGSADFHQKVVQIISSVCFNLQGVPEGWGLRDNSERICQSDKR